MCFICVSVFQRCKSVRIKLLPFLGVDNAEFAVLWKTNFIYIIIVKMTAVCYCRIAVHLPVKELAVFGSRAVFANTVSHRSALALHSVEVLGIDLRHLLRQCASARTLHSVVPAVPTSQDTS